MIEFSPVKDWMAGMNVGSRNPNATPPLPRMNEREKEASRFSKPV